MAIPLFLAMTQAELRNTSPRPEKIAWMACHFSPYGTGLTDLPDQLPPGSMLILDDRIGEAGHDPVLICQQLTDTVRRCGPTKVLLDLQHDPTPATRSIVTELARHLPCPVAVPPLYTDGLEVPVFLPPIPPHILPESHLSPWTGHEIWLEMSLDTVMLTVSDHGCRLSPLPEETPAFPHHDPVLHCHYDIRHQNDALHFRLSRTLQDLGDLLEDLQTFGVTTGVGLFQELGDQIYRIKSK